MADDVVKNGAVTLPVVSIPADQKKVDDFFADNPEDPMNDTKREIKTRFELLPKELQEIIVNDDYTKRLFDIAKTQKLTFEELGTLEIETTMVLLGMTKPADYRDELQGELKKNDAEIDAVVKDVNEKIFAPIRASLDKLYSAKKEPAEYLKKDILGKVLDPEATAARVQAPAPVATVIPAPQPAVKPEPSLTSQEKTVLEKTGVVVNEPAPRPAAAPMVMPSRSDVLKGIENPPKASGAGFVSDRLKATTPVMPTIKVTDYSVAKPSVPAAAPASTAQPAKPAGPDPYREPIS